MRRRDFVWNPMWCREIGQNAGLYFYLDARLFVRDQTPDEGDPFYWLEAAVPADSGVVDQVLRR